MLRPSDKHKHQDPTINLARYYNIPCQKSKENAMKISEERLFEIAAEEYKSAGLDPHNEGVAQWAYYSAQQEYRSEEEVREELRELIKQDKEMGEEVYHG